MLISSELSEILGLSDRIYVMQSGRITGELPGPGTTEEQVLNLAMAENLTTDEPGFIPPLPPEPPSALAPDSTIIQRVQ